MGRLSVVGACAAARMGWLKSSAYEMARSREEAMNTRATWRQLHFSRRLGETVADAHYACSLERPKPKHNGWWIVGVLLIVAAVLLPHFWR